MWAKHGPGLAEVVPGFKTATQDMGQMSNVVFGPDVKCRYVGDISIADLDRHLKSITNIFD